MFKQEGTVRSLRKNQGLAGYLAFVAGYVNSCGFVRIGLFTSHVTGNVGRAADRLALGKLDALDAVALIAAFFAGAFAASVALESDVARSRPRIYGALLAAEALLLVTAAALDDTASGAAREGVLLAGAMGLQNSLVTRLSGAVVRTTHLTGVVTDLGIEAARWFRFWRGRAAARTGLHLVAGHAPDTAPPRDRALLLLTIFGAFVAGGLAGAPIAVHAGAIAFALPIALVAAAAWIAFSSRVELPAPRGA